MNEIIPLQYGSVICPRLALSVLELETDSTVKVKNTQATSNIALANNEISRTRFLFLPENAK
jgi:hypothetical protein